MSTINISSNVSYFFELFDTLADNPSTLFDPDHFGYIEGLFGLSEIVDLPITSLSSTEIIASDGLGHSITLLGSGFGPVANIADLETAIADGLATGIFSQIIVEGPPAVGQPPTVLLTVDLTATGFILTSGNDVISITGDAPTSMSDFYDLVDIFSRVSIAGSLDADGRSQLIADLSDYSVTGFALTDAGETLMEYTSTSTAVSFSIDGYTITLTGAFPTNFGEDMAVIFEILDMVNAGAMFDTISEIGAIPIIELSTLTITGPDGAVLVETVGDIFAEPVTVMLDGVDIASINIEMDVALWDYLVGSPDADYLFGLAGNDEILADAGDDYLFGGSGNDQLNGEGGDDQLIGSSGNDILIGGAGWDVARYNYDDANGGTQGIIASLSANVAIDTFGDIDTLSGIEEISGSVFGDVIIGDAGANTLSGFAGADTLAGGAGNDQLYGGAGVDMLFGGIGDDTLYGASAGVDNPDTDFLFGDEGNDTLYGGGGLDVLLGGDDNDTLFGGDATDSLNGGAGADVLVGGGGTDILFGGLGADVFLFATPSEGPDLIKDFASGEDGIALIAANFGLTATGGSLAGTGMFKSGVGLPADFGAPGTPVVYYETSSNALLVDSTGGDSSDAVLIAILETGTLTESDVFLL